MILTLYLLVILKIQIISDALVGNTEIKESGSLGQDAIDELLADSQNITEISQETKNENSLKDNSLSGAMDQNEIDALLTDALEDNVDSTLSDLNINEKTEEITENKESISVSENTSKTLTKPSINEEIQKPIITPESQKINSYVPPITTTRTCTCTTTFCLNKFRIFKKIFHYQARQVKLKI